MNGEKTYERVVFRLLKTPCCGALLCWVNPRFPNYCPECGHHIYPDVRGCVLVHDDEAVLEVESGKTSHVPLQPITPVETSPDLETVP